MTNQPQPIQPPSSAQLLLKLIRQNDQHAKLLERQIHLANSTNVLLTGAMCAMFAAGLFSLVYLTSVMDKQ